MRTYIKDLKVGKEVTMNGWLHEIRDLAKIKFLLLRDRTGIIQCVVLSDNQETFDLVPKLKQETAVEIKGKVVENKVAKLGYEVQVDSVEVLGEVLQVLPIQVVEKGDINTDLSTRLDYRFLDLRKPEIQKIFQVRDSIYKTTVDFFSKQGFIAVNTPKMTSAGVESGADMFTIDYFGTKAYLSQSPQIYKQMLVCSGFEKVFEIGTVFRAEKSNTSRHQTEFTGVDFEMGFVKNLSEIMDVTEAYLKEVLSNLEDIEVALPGKIPRVEMVELKKMLKEKGKELGENEDLDSESEQLVGDLIKEKHGCDFVFVINYPWDKRPFYHVKNGNGTKSFDLLFKGVEIATGSLREHRYEVLKAQAKEKGVDLDAMEDYVLLFKCGAPPHGGCGLGLDRIAQRLLGLDNVREVVFLPRDPDRLRP
ncbi:aspartate--tRNA(Asn) ligase [archaeon]|jgi:nondiscriminating aspartyl-tRNA synthetase|nr:aspartate--tRNA(Asn) ligase [archaeon]MBT4397247.1 aspartate--tRNA(Asn) ligase [archaeon]MBT4440627.1 aspartate--tRNA(Asn) ligase [archaeon]